MKEPSTAADLLHNIRDSAGSRYLNRAHERSFSINVFQMNAVELMGATQRVKDPDQGIALMMQKNREAGQQAHRELNRHVHNFVSSALTLVEHTRGFMRKHYTGSDLLAIYENQATTAFAQSPVAQFVQDLRNHMVHRGLPNSSMFMTFTTDPDAKDGSGSAETGVRYNTASLLDWKGWRPVARNYIEQAGEHLDIQEFVREYLALVNQFNGWLDITLAEHHQSDLQELGQLQAQLEAISWTNQPISIGPGEASDYAAIEPFEFTSAHTIELDQTSISLLGKIRELHFQQTTREFPTERPTTLITEHEIVGPITFWGRDANGDAAFMFIQHEGKSYGLSESDYKSLDSLTEAVMKSTWARASLSREFVENTFCDWARQRFGTDGQSFPEALSTAARNSVTEVEIWAPIANFEVEHAFEFGSVRIESISASVMENLRSRVASTRPDQEQQVGLLFEKLRDDIQGYAAVVIPMDAEPIVAQQRAQQIAQDVVGLLSFFSPAARPAFMFSPVALKGAEYIPSSKLIVLSEHSFILNESILPKHLGFWRLRAEEISELKSGLLDTAASLVLLEGLSEFAQTVRASLLTYSKGITLAAPHDRLRNCLSALEGVFLRHEIEPRAHCIANRMSFLLAHKKAAQEAIRQVVRQIYWLQSQSRLEALSRRENELIIEFTSYAYDALSSALANTQTFSAKARFLMEVDKAGLSTQ
jgi:hypothetical protein